MIKVLGLLILAASNLSGCAPQQPRVDFDGKPELMVASDSPEITDAIEDSLRYLVEEGDRWMEGQAWVQDGNGCVSCHHVGYALWSHREAERAGLRLEDSGIDDLRRRAYAFQTDKPQVVPATQMILADAYEAGDAWALAAKGHPDGYWEAKGQFPSQRRSVQESDGVATLWALFALDSLDSLDDEAGARRDRALEWLSGARDGVSNEWTAARLIVETSLGHAERRAELLDKLLRTQKPDGGWGWLEEDPSNPFSTGQSIYALSIAADAQSLAAIQRGVDYLLARQQTDGTWLTPSKYTSERASKDRDYIYRYWGTAWASMGLARALARLGGADAAPGHDLATREPRNHADPQKNSDITRR